MVLLGGAGSAPGRADSGSIADVHAVGDGQLAATYSATSTECTAYGYCGWFPAAWQVNGSDACSADGDHIVYVGSLQDTTGTQTATDTFYPAFEPVKLCLYIYRDGLYRPVAETLYGTPPAAPRPVPPPVAGPTELLPAADAQIPAARSVLFRVQTPERDDFVSIEVSKSAAQDADGTLVDDQVIDSELDLEDGTTRDVLLEGAWTRRPGIYYWQASRVACNADISDCAAESEVRRLEILPPPLTLRVTAQPRQQLRRTRLSRMSDLVVSVRCNRDCSVRLRGYATYRNGGRRLPLHGLGLREALELTGGRVTRYGFHFTAAKRSRLIAVMRRHGPVRWRMELRATTDDGDAQTATRLIRMTPPPLPAPSRPSPGSPPSNPSCDPSYPGVCIPPPPPDLDCGDIPYSDFTVVGSDPHGFDGDGDGVGCES